MRLLTSVLVVFLASATLRAASPAPTVTSGREHPEQVPDDIAFAFLMQQLADDIAGPHVADRLRGMGLREDEIKAASVVARDLRGRLRAIDERAADVAGVDAGRTLQTTRAQLASLDREQSDTVNEFNRGLRFRVSRVTEQVMRKHIEEYVKPRVSVVTIAPTPKP